MATRKADRDPKDHGPTFVKQVRHTLSHDEKFSLGMELADAQRELEDAHARADSIKKTLGMEIKAAEIKLAGLASTLRTGYEFRDLECRAHYDRDSGMAIIRRLDTGEEVERRPMTESERQRVLLPIPE